MVERLKCKRKCKRFCLNFCPLLVPTFCPQAVGTLKIWAWTLAPGWKRLRPSHLVKLSLTIFLSISFTQFKKNSHFCRLECGWRHSTARPTRSCTWRWSRPTANGLSGCSSRAAPTRFPPREKPALRARRANPPNTWPSRLCLLQGSERSAEPTRSTGMEQTVADLGARRMRYKC